MGQGRGGRVFEQLEQAGFEVIIKNHAGAIFSVDFAKEAQELIEALLEMRIPAAELVASGGGEARSTQWLRHRLYESDWHKHNFRFEQFVDGVPQVSITHEIDHVRRGAGGVIALEIEWNNKDPFFDRDLENFQRLHAQSAISLGVIVTRGASLQSAMTGIVQRCLEKHGVVDESDRLSRLNAADWDRLKALIGVKRVRVVALDLPTSHQLIQPGADEFTARMLDAINGMMLDMLAAIARKDYEDRRRRHPS